MIALVLPSSQHTLLLFINFQADLGRNETVRLTSNGRNGQLQNGLPDWLYEGEA